MITYVEFGMTGHRPIWIRSVIQAFANRDSGCQLNIWVPREFVEVHKQFCSPYLQPGVQSSTGIAFRFHEGVIGPREAGYLSGLGRFEIIQRCIEVDNSDVCFVANNLDSFVRFIAISRPGAYRAKFVGVLCTPFLHYLKFPPPLKRGLSIRRYTKTYLINFLMCHRFSVGEVLMLDPLAPAFYNAILGTSKFRYLPEYITCNKPIPDFRKHFGLPEDRLILLFPGAIDRRKGIFEFLQALRKASLDDSSFHRKVAVVLAGNVAEWIRDTLYAAISDFRLSYPDMQVFVFDRFLTDREFVSLISISDVVCMPYVNFIGTSSILMHAAAYGKPVLASDFGVIGEFVRRYNLGIVCDESNPVELADALHISIEESSNMSEERRQAIRNFAARYSVPLERFGEEVRDSLVKIAYRK